jgi:hypothetical protein
MNNPKLQTDFIREICTYFMDFLQSNFKRGRIPKRHIKLKDAKGFKVGVDASKYPDFNKALKNVVIKNVNHVVQNAQRNQNAQNVQNALIKNVNHVNQKVQNVQKNIDVVHQE